jgi:adenosine kinase
LGDNEGQDNKIKVRIVVITDSGNPVTVATGGQVFTVDAVSVDKSRIIDPNGAGDSFVGGFLGNLAEF